jgi:hypothetical protein
MNPIGKHATNLILDIAEYNVEFLDERMETYYSTILIADNL